MPFLASGVEVATGGHGMVGQSIAVRKAFCLCDTDVEASTIWRNGASAGSGVLGRGAAWLLPLPPPPRRRLAGDVVIQPPARDTGVLGDLVDEYLLMRPRAESSAPKIRGTMR